MAPTPLTSRGPGARSALRLGRAREKAGGGRAGAAPRKPEELVSAATASAGRAASCGSPGPEGEALGGGRTPWARPRPAAGSDCSRRVRLCVPGLGCRQQLPVVLVHTDEWANYGRGPDPAV